MHRALYYASTMHYTMLLPCTILCFYRALYYASTVHYTMFLPCTILCFYRALYYVSNVHYASNIHYNCLIMCETKIAQFDARDIRKKTSAIRNIKKYMNLLDTRFKIHHQNLLYNIPL